MTVYSEVGHLKEVIVHTPGAALARMLPRHTDPRSPDYLLFDDLVDVPKARAEHDRLCAVLETVAQVHRLETLLAEVLEKPEARQRVIADAVALSQLSERATATLESLRPAALAETLISGTVGGAVDGEPLMPPIPNLIFTRDLAAVTGGHLVVGNARKPARRRESVLVWALVDHHPSLQHLKVARISREVRQRGGSYPLTIEGGDVLVVSNSLVCIGASERTSWAMIVQLADELLDSGFSRVLVVEMPRQRSSMHLDTVFTLLSWDRCVVYNPLLKPTDRQEAYLLRLRREGGHTVVEPLQRDLLDALALEGYPLQEIPCGGGHPIDQHREQWTDGANYVALCPGVVVGYARNRRTAAACAAAGFEDLSVSAFCDLFETAFHADPQALIASERRFAVHIAGSELSRGRGGPRCLTLPIRRDG